jgi:hypothetical protein
MQSVANQTLADPGRAFEGMPYGLCFNRTWGAGFRLNENLFLRRAEITVDAGTPKNFTVAVLLAKSLTI